MLMESKMFLIAKVLVMSSYLGDKLDLHLKNTIFEETLAS